jgi:hypothetical protein
MADQNKNGTMIFLFLCSAGIMIVSFIASCGKTSVSAAAAKIQMQVVNLSPDAQPIDLFVGYKKQNVVAYSYPTPSGYFSLNDIDTPVQIRSHYASVSTTNFVSINTALKPNFKYTLCLTGLRADSTITSIFTTDTATTPAAGRGKIRFVNASPRSPGFDITANGVMAFTNQTYKNVSKFLEIPPGTYDFKIMLTGTSNPISDLPGVIVLDGKVYTIYCRGIYGGADSVAFGAGVLPNR